MVHRKFYRILCLKITEDEIEFLVLRLIKFFNGGLTEVDLMNSPITKLLRYSQKAVKIANEIKEG